MIHVTDHAVRRFQERIAAVGIGEARRRILSYLPMLEIAHDFGAPVVRTGDGMGLVLKHGAVVTVLAPGMRIGPVQ
jgi:hypothetical protein